jgi:hypothetical protein
MLYYLHSWKRASKYRPTKKAYNSIISYVIMRSMGQSQRPRGQGVGLDRLDAEIVGLNPS